MDRHFHVQSIGVNRGVSRRSFLGRVSAASIAAGTLTFPELVGLEAATLKKQGKSVILLWLAGGPSQFETFDPKPSSKNGGPTQAIDTSVAGIQLAEHWPQTAKMMSELALIRSMTNREGNHRRATYQLHTGYAPSGSVKHPSLAANVAKQLADSELPLPSVVSVGPTVGAGFLGVDYEPFVVNNPGQVPQNVANPVGAPRYRRRLGLLGRLESEFAERGGRTVVNNQKTIYSRASKLVLSKDVEVFDLSEESSNLVSQYGNSAFGRGCLLARRLVEAGVTFVEVRSGGWDTHQDNFNRTKTLSEQVDGGLATLLSDLKDRGRLDNTLVVCMGEFGRTPRINPRTGRDHYPRVFSSAIAGAGVRGGQVVGRSTDDGSAVGDRPVSVNDLFSSICHAIDVDPTLENISPLGRPMKIVDGGETVNELFS